MSENAESGRPEAAGGETSGQHPYVERLRPDPSQPPRRVLVLTGLRGDSIRPGYQRLYFTRGLDHFAEFRSEDVIFSEPVPADESPLTGLEATRVTLARDATIDFTRTRTARPIDEFDLDIRLGVARRAGFGPGVLTFEPCTDGTCDTCRGRGCVFPTERDTCPTDCGQATCDTCLTRCDQQTCGQATCATCETCCGQATCGQATCHTCLTACDPAGCAPHVTRQPCQV